MEFASSRAHIPYRWHLRRLHHFSTFSLDSFYLIERGEVATAGAYMIASVVLSVSALIAGVQIVRLL
jgi:fluoride ion exporter CrcB/FEX